MRYRERLELYKRKALSAQESQRVEEDIERQEAISEYLFEKEEEAAAQFSFPGKEQEEQETDAFTSRVNRAIRRAFIKMGVVVCGVTLILVLLILFVLPEAVSRFYYDPGRITGEDSYGNTTNQMSLDMAVYTELMVPGYFRCNVQVDDRGYGDYDITIYQNYSRTGMFTNAAGRIEKGRLYLYDINQLRRPVGNVFGWFQMNPEEGKSLTELVDAGGEENSHFFAAAGDKGYAEEQLKDLDEDGLSYAYVTLDRLMSYDEYRAFIDTVISDESCAASEIWCAPVTQETEDGMLRISNLGFYIQAGSSATLSWDREKYPDLVMRAALDYEGDFQEEMDQKLGDEEGAAEHFAVMLDYMAEQEEFLAMMQDGESPDTLRAAAEYVRENGLMVYGFGCCADKETLLKINEMEEVYLIDTEPVR